MEKLEKEINESLKRKFGSNSSGLQYYRVSFSNTQTEVRKRKYNKTSGKIILIRDIYEEVECKKYPTIKERWLLEKWVPPDSCYTDQIVSAKRAGSYEAVYIFQDINGNYLPLNQRVAEIITANLATPVSVTDDSEYAQRLEDENELKIQEEEVGKAYEYIKVQDGRSENRIISERKIDDGKDEKLIFPIRG